MSIHNKRKHVLFNPPLRIFESATAETPAEAKERIQRFARPKLQRNVHPANVAKYFGTRNAAFGQALD